MNWFSGPTAIETTLTDVVLPIAAGILALDALAGLVFVRWLRRRPRWFLWESAIGAPVGLAVFALFLLWAVRQDYGMFGGVAVVGMAYLIKLAYDAALLALQPGLGWMADPKGPEHERTRILRWLSPAAPLLVFALVLLTALLPNEQESAVAGLLLVLFALAALLCLAQSILVPIRAARDLKARGAPVAARRLARLGWLFLASFPVAAALGALSTVFGSMTSEYGFGPTVSLGILALAVLAAFPTAAVATTAAAMLAASGKKET